MGDKQRFIPFYERSPLGQLAISILVVLIAGSALFTGLLLAGSSFFGTNAGILEDPSFATGDNEIAFLKFVLVAQDIGIFIVPSLIILMALRPSGKGGLPGFRTPCTDEIVMVVMLSFCVFPISSLTGQINEAMKLPGWLSWLEDWMRTKEDNISHMLGVIVGQGTIWAVILNVAVMALMPAVGEELIFRGVLQKIGYRLFRSEHISVWVTALLFSAVHLQFYGLLPRFILGLVFGYLFLWSGNLFLPMIAHFVNNAVPTIAASLADQNSIDISPGSPFMKQLFLVMFPLMAGILILNWFRNRRVKEIPASGACSPE